jgi:hypothetical protein
MSNFERGIPVLTYRDISAAHDFRVNHRIFATLNHDREYGVVTLTLRRT